MKKIHLLTILLIILNSFAAARIAAGIVSYRLAHVVGKRPVLATSATTPASSESLTAFAPILEQGLFGKATQGKLTPVVVAAPAAGEQPVNQANLTLVGTAQGSYRETFALIRRASPPEERVFRLGESVFGLGPLVGVQKERAEIMAGGRRITLFTPTAAPTEPPPQQGGPQASPIAATQTAPGSFVIDQRALNAALDNIGQAMTDARLLPSVKDGKVEGFRVSEVKPAGVFGMVGIRNGDVLRSINDLPIDSPERAIQSLASLKGQSRIKLDLIRDGQPTTFTYDIR